MSLSVVSLEFILFRICCLFYGFLVKNLKNSACFFNFISFSSHIILSFRHWPLVIIFSLPVQLLLFNFIFWIAVSSCSLAFSFMKCNLLFCPLHNIFISDTILFSSLNSTWLFKKRLPFLSLLSYLPSNP